MIEPPRLSDQQIEDRTTARSFERGLGYFEGDFVGQVLWRKGLLMAEVAGSGDEPYVVQVRIDENGKITSAECSCPADYGGDCKHTVATLLFYQANRDNIEQRPAIEDLIVGLDEDQLRLLVLHLVSRRPGMMRSAEKFVNTVTRRKK